MCEGCERGSVASVASVTAVEVHAQAKGVLRAGDITERGEGKRERHAHVCCPKQPLG